MNISRGDSQSTGRGPSALNRQPALQPKQHVIRALAALRRFIQQPFMPLLGVLIGAGAAKSGHGGWAASMILVSLSTYFGVVATAMLTRNLGAWAARMQRYGEAEFCRTQRRHAGLPPRATVAQAAFKARAITWQVLKRAA